MQAETQSRFAPVEASKRPNRRARRAVFAKMRSAHRRARRRLLRAQKAYSCAPEEAQYILLCLDAGMKLRRDGDGWEASDGLGAAEWDSTPHGACMALVTLLEELERQQETEARGAAEDAAEHLGVADERTPGIHPRGDA